MSTVNGKEPHKLTEDEMVESVRVGMRMGGGELSEEAVAGIRRLYRGETTPDEEALAALQRLGYGDTPAAHGIMARLKKNQ